MQDAEIKSPPRQTSFAKRNEAIERLKRRADAIRALGATSLYLFGSVAREETGPASDLDFIDSIRQAASAPSVSSASNSS
ncbi:nucleotidyltransferase family protein [Rhizobium mongolense]|uniref:Nucleotidyltransferase n=2 Tax=Rhizobium mongolense TaxID=57676 RepID=A0ABR6IJ95_9HYPH|nr:nucleotidyltransferase domain-containing protein [Rhizobium mongolense]MBB4227946.1 putative nucleotidyltransferase [Rhizobium mongolense]TVZ64897.1 nucleotidyltransferase-like protein [Rhizobium mongolense USDA 1844]